MNEPFMLGLNTCIKRMGGGLSGLPPVLSVLL